MLYHLSRLAVGAGLSAALLQVPTAHPSLPVFWAGVVLALFGAMGLADEAAS